MQVVSWQKRFQKDVFQYNGPCVFGAGLRIFISLYCACSTRKFSPVSKCSLCIRYPGRLTFSSNLLLTGKARKQLALLCCCKTRVSPFVNVDHGKSCASSGRPVTSSTTEISRNETGSGLNTGNSNCTRSRLRSALPMVATSLA